MTWSDVPDAGGARAVALPDGLIVPVVHDVDQLSVGRNLTAVTEERGVAGCNGSSDGYRDNCYLAGGVHVNEKKWIAPARYFGDTPGPSFKNDWHFVEAYFELNSIREGKGVNDGIVQYWLDGQPVIDRRDVLPR